MNKNHWAQKLDHSFFSFFILETFRKQWWDTYFHWHYLRFKQTDQYFEDLPDWLGCYCMGGEL